MVAVQRLPQTLLSGHQPVQAAHLECARALLGVGACSGVAKGVVILRSLHSRGVTCTAGEAPPRALPLAEAVLCRQGWRM